MSLQVGYVDRWLGVNWFIGWTLWCCLWYIWSQTFNKVMFLKMFTYLVVLQWFSVMWSCRECAKFLSCHRKLLFSLHSSSCTPIVVGTSFDWIDFVKLVTISDLNLYITNSEDPNQRNGFEVQREHSKHILSPDPSKFHSLNVKSSSFLYN